MCTTNTYNKLLLVTYKLAPITFRRCYIRTTYTRSHMLLVHDKETQKISSKFSQNVELQSASQNDIDHSANGR